MKVFYLLSLFLAISIKIFAVDTIKTARPNIPFNEIKLGFTTASVLIPEVRVTYEHRWKKFSWDAGIGTVVPKQYIIDDTIKGVGNGYSCFFDFRLHNHNPSRSGVFVGIGMFYRWFKYPHTGLFADSQVTQFHPSVEEDRYLLKKTTVGVVLQFGGHHYIGKRLDVEMSIGIGPKLMFTDQDGRTNPNSVYANIEPNVHAVESELGTTWSAAIQPQISIGYILSN